MFSASGTIVLDASGEFVRNSLGDFDLCQSINQRGVTATRYCLLTLQQKFASKTPARIGLCAANSCSSEDLQTVATSIIARACADCSDRFGVQRLQCAADAEWTHANSILCTLLAAFVLFALIDFVRPIEGRCHLTHCFSLRSNYRHLLASRKPLVSPAGCKLDTRVIDCLRSVSMIWVICVHSMSFASHWLVLDNAVVVDEIWPASFVYQWLYNGTFSVDNFFVLSGLLEVLKCHARNRRPARASESLASVIQSCARRYSRLMPLLLFVITASVLLLPHLSNGPLWQDATLMFDTWCRDKWLINLMGAQNLVQTQTMCFSHSWYVAVDLQLFVLTRILQFVCGAAMLRVSMIITLAAQFSAAAMVYLHQLPPAPLVPVDNAQSMLDFYRLLYIKPHYWLTSHTIGSCLGLCALRLSSQGRKPTRRVAMSVGIAASVTMFVIHLSTWPYFLRVWPSTTRWASLQVLLVRPLWSLSIASLLLLSMLLTHERASWLSRVLRARLWAPLARLTYAAYLCHPLIMAMFYGSQRASMQLTRSLVAYFALGNVVYSYAFAAIIHLLVELPLERMLRRRR